MLFGAGARSTHHSTTFACSDASGRTGATEIRRTIVVVASIDSLPMFRSWLQCHSTHQNCRAHPGHYDWNICSVVLIAFHVLATAFAVCSQIFPFLRCWLLRVLSQKVRRFLRSQGHGRVISSLRGGFKSNSNGLQTCRGSGMDCAFGRQLFVAMACSDVLRARIVIYVYLGTHTQYIYTYIYIYIYTVYTYTSVFTYTYIYTCTCVDVYALLENVRVRRLELP